MDDSFFAAASNLDQLLDDFEESETPKQKSKPGGKSKSNRKGNKSKSSNQENSITPTEKSISRAVGNLQNNEQKIFDEPIPNNRLTKPENSAKSELYDACETGLLIDFGESNVEQPKVTGDVSKETVSSLSSVDLLLSSFTPQMNSVTETSADAPAISTSKREKLLSPKNSGKAKSLLNNTSNESADEPEVTVTKTSPNHQETDQALMDEFEQFYNDSVPILLDENVNKKEKTTQKIPQTSQALSITSMHKVSPKKKASVQAVEVNANTSRSNETGNGSANKTTAEQNAVSKGITSPAREQSSTKRSSRKLNSKHRSKKTTANIQSPTNITAEEQTTVSADQPSTSRLLVDPSSGENTAVPTTRNVPGNEQERYGEDMPQRNTSWQQELPNVPPPSYSSVMEEVQFGHQESVNSYEDEAQSDEIANSDQLMTIPEEGTQGEALLEGPAMSSSSSRTDQSTVPGLDIQANYIQRPGRVKPRWVPDEESPICTNCGVKFSFTRRRHHCRACGRIFCSACGSEKGALEYMDFAEARICVSCHSAILQADAMAEAEALSSHTPSPRSSGPKPVLKPPETESPNGSGSSKSVRFSDGTRPDHPSPLPDTPPLPSRMHRIDKMKHRSAAIELSSSLPPLVVDMDPTGNLMVEEYPTQEYVAALLKPDNPNPIRFALSSNLFVSVQVVEYESVPCYYFQSYGLDSVGQSEVAIILEKSQTDQNLPILVFTIYTYLFTNSRKGKSVNALDFVNASDISASHEGDFIQPNVAGVMFVRKTFQDDQFLPSKDEDDPFNSFTVKFSSTLFALLVLTSEKPWARLFPSRLLLGLGAQHQKYPYPLGNLLNREPVYKDVGNTILSILCDFRNYKYKVVSVQGLSIVIKENGIVVNIPANRFSDITKILNSSNEHVLAVGSDAFSVEQDLFSSHLVALQDSESLAYRSEVMLNKSAEAAPAMGTGAGFIVFNGSLKSGNTQQARSTVVEDGVMIQILPEKMAALKEALKAMDDFMINFNSSTKLSPEKVKEMTNKQPCQFVEVRWVQDDTKFNIGLSSPIDFQSLEGVAGYNVQGKSEKKGKQNILRWNQVFFFKSTGDVLDMSRLSEQMADGCFQALVPHLQLLRKAKQNKIGIRINVHPDDVGYAVGSQGLPLPDSCLNALDEHLIFLLHEASSHLQPEDDVVVFELIFSVLEIRSNWKVVQ